MQMKLEFPNYRPPSEAYSILIRATRNCPWNKCTFCGMYKGKKFSRRAVDEVKADIQSLKNIADTVRRVSWELGMGGRIDGMVWQKIIQDYGIDIQAFPWLFYDSNTAFIADSNSLILKTEELAEIVRCVRQAFPNLERVTSYARAKTILGKTIEELQLLRESGLNRLHLGLETGDAHLLEFIRKGATPEEMIAAGKKIKSAGITLSEYVILGLGGRDRWREHALGTAQVLNEINPDFIRVRTLHLEKGTPLNKQAEDGTYILASPFEVLQEEKLLLENLKVTSEFVSDHISN